MNILIILSSILLSHYCLIKSNKELEIYLSIILLFLTVNSIIFWKSF